ncbi:hypothetical protein Cfla_0279 [Cellulomonas flavigena DSM 20109]|uniref:Uncharacterized protein n=1 Tax=Cellulomonas flavigena (strain ATCC 482 / DSM 20109 / BCRC 11376 / JCM 18109 / NBRC 3775 / NCIMB 8073 / NRS 134) TaxID=446466 RepID=D5UGZ5_CELFN|nr:hypothetical protein [Cellulomonas flavigena]ADG73198.1 hypothetical protein Cfla_0279 [Cellulomonas flavigena DSM 20109]
MFEYRKADRRDVSALFGEGIEVLDRYHVVDEAAGYALVRCGSDRPDEDDRGRARDHYLLRRRDQVLGLVVDVLRRTDEHGTYALLVPGDIGRSHVARWHMGVPDVDLDLEEEVRVRRIASEACLVLEASHGTYPRPRVVDPFDGVSELAPEDYGYLISPRLTFRGVQGSSR